MLRHVGREQDATQPVQRRDQCRNLSATAWELVENSGRACALAPEPATAQPGDLAMILPRPAAVALGRLGDWASAREELQRVTLPEGPGVGAGTDPGFSPLPCGVWDGAFGRRTSIFTFVTPSRPSTMLRTSRTSVPGSSGRSRN